jgi:CDP-paratose 2-epimerase
MNILITGVCGFVGSELALRLRERLRAARICGLDNLSRPGSERSGPRLAAAGIDVRHGDIRCAGDLDAFGDVDWIIEAAAYPSVLAGVDGRTTSRQLVDTNLLGTVNVLEACKARRAGIVVLSSSRVYSADALNGLPLTIRDDAFVPDQSAEWPAGATAAGIAEDFPTSSPLSLYGATKLASEVMAIEYGGAFGFPAIVNRCGVIAGAGQFGTAEQGIFGYWVRAWASGLSLGYNGFAGRGHQVRDAMHPADLADLVERQLRAPEDAAGVWNVGGGPANAMSLAQVSRWCANRFGAREVVSSSAPRRWDVPWVVMDTSRARARFGWSPSIALTDVLDEIADHHRVHPEWLSLSKA